MVNTYSYWEKNSFFSYDVILVGSGIVGLNAAITLKRSQPELKIAILEGGLIPAGASTKNAGFACFGSVSELIDQEKRIGTDALVSLIEKRWSGLTKLRKLIGDATLDFQCHGGYELFKKEDTQSAEESVSKIDHFNRLTENVVGKKAFEMANRQIADFSFAGISHLIRNRYEAQLDTGKMMYALIQLAHQSGIFIFNNCKVDKVEENGSSISAFTSQGNFSCRKLILSTNAFIKSILPEVAIEPGRGQVLVTKPITRLRIQGTFHYDAGYYYFRNINNRLLLGGGRNADFINESTTQFGTTAIVQKSLQDLLSKVILPDTPFEIDYTWSGIMAFGNSLEPFVEEVRPGIFCATRCNGMGIAIGAQTGSDVAQLLLNTL